MKIAVWHNLPSGGGARALQNHLHGLISAGHEVEVWAANPTANGFIDIPQGVKLHTVPLVRHQKLSFIDKVSSIFLKNDRNLKEMEKHSKQCAEEINAGNFDLLFANSCYYYAAPMIGRYITNIKKIVYLGEPFRAFYEAQPRHVWFPPESVEGNWLRRSYWSPFFADLWRVRNARVQMREERRNAKAFDKILVNSIFSQETVERAYNLGSEVCYLGINTHLFKPTHSTTQNYVIGLGNFYQNKNPKLAIQAIAEIKENRPDLVWVANMIDDAYYHKQKQLAEELGVKLIIKKLVTDQELVNLLNGALCMIYTSRLEPFGFAPLEANACGLPVVALNQGGLRETIIQNMNGFLCSKNKFELAEKVQLLVNDAEKRTKMSQFAVENAQKNWSIEACWYRINEAIKF